jgi:hypothetical protein
MIHNTMSTAIKTESTYMIVRNGSAIGMSPINVWTAHQSTPRMIRAKMMPIRVPIMLQERGTDHVVP